MEKKFSRQLLSISQGAPWLAPGPDSPANNTREEEEELKLLLAEPEEQTNTLHIPAVMHSPVGEHVCMWVRWTVSEMLKTWPLPSHFSFKIQMRVLSFLKRAWYGSAQGHEAFRAVKNYYWSLLSWRRFEEV